MCPQKYGKQFSGKPEMRSFWERQVAERRHVLKKTQRFPMISRNSLASDSCDIRCKNRVLAHCG